MATSTESGNVRVIGVLSSCSRGSAAGSRRDVHPAAGAGRVEDGLGDAGGAQAVGEGGEAVGRLGGEGGVGVGDEGVEAVLVALRVAGGDDGVASGTRPLARAAEQLPVHLAAADPQRVRVLLVEAEALA